MGGENIAVVGFHRLSKEGFCMSENCLAIGGGGEIVDACGRMYEVVIRL